MERVGYFVSSDGQRAVEIERQENGFYRWVEWTQFPGDEYVEDYMSPTHFSGLYASMEAAERDARCLPWMCDDKSN